MAACELIKESQRTCLLQLELLHASVVHTTDTLQHQLRQESSGTHDVVRVESQKIMEGQAQILQALGVQKPSEAERKQLALEAQQHLDAARRKASASEQHFIEQVSGRPTSSCRSQLYHDNTARLRSHLLWW